MLVTNVHVSERERERELENFTRIVVGVLNDVNALHSLYFYERTLPIFTFKLRKYLLLIDRI